MTLFLCFLVSVRFHWEDVCKTQDGVSTHFQTPQSSKIYVLHCTLYFQLSIIVWRCGQTQSFVFDSYILMLKFSADCFACISFQTCYICEERGRESKTAHGACMNCNKTGCRHAFHVTWWASLFMLSTLFLW